MNLSSSNHKTHYTLLYQVIYYSFIIYLVLLSMRCPESRYISGSQCCYWENAQMNGMTFCPMEIFRHIPSYIYLWRVSYDKLLGFFLLLFLQYRHRTWRRNKVQYVDRLCHVNNTYVQTFIDYLWMFLFSWRVYAQFN